MNYSALGLILCCAGHYLMPSVLNFRGVMCSSMRIISSYPLSESSARHCGDWTLHGRTSREERLLITCMLLCMLCWKLSWPSSLLLEPASQKLHEHDMHRLELLSQEALNSTPLATRLAAMFC